MKRYVRILLNIAVPLLWLFLLCVLGPRLLGFFMPFVIGWILAMIANPPVRFLERRLRLVRRHGSMVIVVGVLVDFLSGIESAFWIFSGFDLKQIAHFEHSLFVYDLC